MAESTTTEKVICMPSENRCDPMAWMAMANNNGWNNNPFIWLIFMAWMNNGGWGNWNGNGGYTQHADLSRQLQTLQGTVVDNHNNDLALQAINGNREALGQLAQTFNTDLGNIQMAVSSVKAAIESVGGAVGYTSESIKNAIALGDKDIMKQICDCCCSTKSMIADGFNQTQRTMLDGFNQTQRTIMEGFNGTQREILNGNYQSQLATERQTGVLGSKIDNFAAQNALSNCQQTNALERSIEGVRQSVVSGFSQVGYQMAADKAEIIQNNTYQTQRVLDAICQQSTQALRDQLADKDRQLQTQTIIAQLKKEAKCACGL